MRWVLRGLAGVVVGLLLMSTVAGADTIVAYPPYGISDAVMASSPGDTILVSPGAYRERGAVVRHALTVIGVGGAEMNEIEACFDLCQPGLFVIYDGVQGVVIEGLTVTTSEDEPDPTFAEGVHLSYGAEARIADCVFHSLRYGISAASAHVDVRSCQFFRSERENGVGISMQGGTGEIVGNTFVSSGCGIALGNGASPLIARNIFAFNISGGVCCWSASAPTFECNDAWSNPDGNYGTCEDPTGTNGNISADPLFCDFAERDFHLQAESPCLPANSPPGCGLIGALGPCEPVVSVPDAGWALLQLSVTPNPMRHRAEIAFNTRLENPMLEIYDAHGRVVDIVQPGAPPYTWQPSPAARPGVYFIHLRAGGSSAVSKVVLLPR